MKVYLIQDNESDSGPSVSLSRSGAVVTLRKFIGGLGRLTACRSIPGHAEEEELESTIQAFMVGETNEMCVMDDDDFTVAWIKEEEALP